MDKGGPIRLIVPRRYFYKSLKWLETIELLAADRLGYWESDAGYHNHADPWLEERYIASSLDKRQAKQLVESRNISGQDLLSLDLSGRQLGGLQAQNALLRNANFADAQLVQANFDGANLSNANFRQSILTGASFLNSDLEGADLAGADLRGADLTGCSLFGASFCDTDEAGNADNGALLDSETIVSPQQIEALTPWQQHYLSDCLKQNNSP